MRICLGIFPGLTNLRTGFEFPRFPFLYCGFISPLLLDLGVRVGERELLLENVLRSLGDRVDGRLGCFGRGLLVEYLRPLNHVVYVVLDVADKGDLEDQVLLDQLCDFGLDLRGLLSYDLLVFLNLLQHLLSFYLKTLVLLP